MNKSFNFPMRRLTGALMLAGITFTMPAHAQTTSIDNGAIQTVPPSLSTGALYVGENSAGTLNNIAGAVNVSGTTYLGYNAGSTGTVLVSGPGATWANLNPIYVGQFGTGDLTVNNGATLTAQGLQIGAGTSSKPSGVGTVTIDGQGTTVTTTDKNSYGVSVGWYNQGNLTVSGGATLNSFLGYVGDHQSGNGTVTVTGPGSVWNMTDFFGVGGEGTATLTISNGGVINSSLNGMGGNWVGSSDTSNATINVTGAGSAWNAGGYLLLANGNSQLTIADGGKVTVPAPPPACGGACGGTYVGYDLFGLRPDGTSQPANATVTVTGAGSELSAGAFLNVGDSTNGAMQILNGGVVTSDEGAVGVNRFGAAQTTGSVLVRDAGSAWNIGQDGLYVGILSNSTGALTIAQGGAVSSAGDVMVAQNTGSTGSIAIGAAPGQTAVAPGTLSAPNVVFGNGNGSLAFNHTDTSGNYVFAPAISGAGSVDVYNGVTVLTSASNSYSGPTNIQAGALQAGAVNVFSPNSAVAVANAGAIDLAGYSQTVANLNNAGLVNMGTGTAPGAVLTINGNYIGNGGVIALNTYLGTDNSSTDKLVVTGGASGSTNLFVTNAGGPGALTTGDGIKVVETASTTVDAFTLGRRVVLGPYEYTLHLGGLNGANAQDWYLRSTLDCSQDPGAAACGGSSTPPDVQSPGEPSTPPDVQSPQDVPNYRPETALYTALPSMFLTYNAELLDTLHERMGDETAGIAPLGGTGPRPSLGWARVILQGGAMGDAGKGIYGYGPRYHYTMNAVQAGLDLYRAERAGGGSDHAGAYFAVGSMNANARDWTGLAAGSNALTGYTVGGYWARFNANGWYTDAVAQYTWASLSATPIGINRLNTHGGLFAGSLETGKAFGLNNGWKIEPQAQLVYQVGSMADASDSGARVHFSGINSLDGRVGVRVAKRWNPDPADPRRAFTLWARPDLGYTFTGNPVASFSSSTGYVPFHDDMKGAWAQLTAGLDAQITRNTTIYASGFYQTSLNGNRSNGYGGRVGVRVVW